MARSSSLGEPRKWRVAAHGLKKYFLMNGLMLNSKKTQCIFICSRRILAHVPPDTVIKVDGEFMIPSTKVKNLGVHLDRFML